MTETTRSDGAAETDMTLRCGPPQWLVGAHTAPDGTSTRVYHEPCRDRWARELAVDGEFDTQGLFYDGYGWFDPYGVMGSDEQALAASDAQEDAR